MGPMRWILLFGWALWAGCLVHDDVEDTDEDTDDETDLPPEDTGVVLYDSESIHSPVTAEMADAWRARFDANTSLQPDVFMKVGASSTVSSRTLYCFADDGVNLAAYDFLEPTLAYYLDGDAAGTSSFDRDTEAAISGKTARWVMTGDPAPIAVEYEALSPSFALIHYGTNDMGMGSTYASAMPGFYDSMMDLMEWLLERGVLPVLTAISHRGDRETANQWVPSYNTLIRGMAQGQGVPFLNLYEAMDPLEDYGLASDGIHLNKGPYDPCDFSEEALAYGYNMRNLIALQSFDRIKGVLVDGAEGLDPEVTRLQGAGVLEDPFVIDSLPFADHRDTRNATQQLWDAYDCDDADESGPEFVYRLEVKEDTPLRLMVMDRDDVDIDIHLLDSEARCLERGHRQIDTRVTAGSYYVVLDTWVGGDGVARSGPYQLIALECSEGETSCQ